MANDTIQPLRHRMFGGAVNVGGGGGTATLFQPVSSITFGTDIVIDSFVVEYSLGMINSGVAVIAFENLGCQVIEGPVVATLSNPVARDLSNVYWARNDSVVTTVAANNVAVSTSNHVPVTAKILRQGVPVVWYVVTPSVATCIASYNLSFTINYWILNAYVHAHITKDFSKITRP